MKKLIALLLALTMLLVCFAACGEEKPADNKPTEAPADKPADVTAEPAPADGPDAEFNMTACIASEPETVDPNLVSSVDGSTYVMHTFEGLMKYATTGVAAGEDPSILATHAVYGVAESYTVSEDGLTYTFKLRSDAVWSDGQPVKAADFVYSWKRLVNPETAADYGYLLDGIVVNAAKIQAGEVAVDELGITAIDDSTLEIKLEAACPYFVDLCAFATLVPLREDIITQYGAEWTQIGNIVVNGCYTYSEWVHDSYIKMVPNEKYYDYAKLGPGMITFYLNADETSILSSYQTGEYAFVENIPSEMQQTMIDSGDMFILAYIGTYYLYVNTEKVTDWRVRAAINLCIDREFLVKNVTMGGQSPAYSFVPPGIVDSTGAEWLDKNEGILFKWLGEQYTDYDMSSYESRCELAKKLLADAVADGFDTAITVEYLFNTSESHRAIAASVQNDVKNVLGIDLVLNNQEWNVYTNGLAEHTFGLARLGWIADYNDAVTYLELLTNGNSYNYGLWESEAYTNYIATAKSLPGGAERDQNMYDAEALMFNEGGFPIVPLYYYTNPYCLVEGVDSVWYDPFGHFLFMYTQKAK